jgi:hypothetical protein
MEPIQPIEKPQLLDPDRVVDPNRNDFTVDHESVAKELRDALEKTTHYAEQLWDHLDGVRHYLRYMLPPDPRSAGPHTQVGAHPTGPDDTDGWSKWVDIYGSVVSVMAGPHGDSGFGYGEARNIARLRSEAPNVRLAARIGQEFGMNEESSQASPAKAAAEAAKSVDTGMLVRGAGLVALVALALRGLRPR